MSEANGKSSPEVEKDLQDLSEMICNTKDKITLCNQIVKDLNDLKHVLATKSLQDGSLPLHK